MGFREATRHAIWFPGEALGTPTPNLKCTGELQAAEGRLGKDDSCPLISCRWPNLIGSQRSRELVDMGHKHQLPRRQNRVASGCGGTKGKYPTQRAPVVWPLRSSPATLPSHTSLVSQTLLPGPLPLFIPLPGKFFPQTSAWLAPSLRSLFNCNLKQRPCLKELPPTQHSIPLALLFCRVLITT